MLVASRRRWK